jgi:hypothetical protein
MVRCGTRAPKLSAMRLGVVQRNRLQQVAAGWRDHIHYSPHARGRSRRSVDRAHEAPGVENDRRSRCSTGAKATAPVPYGGRLVLESERSRSRSSKNQSRPLEVGLLAAASGDRLECENLSDSSARTVFACSEAMRLPLVLNSPSRKDDLGSACSGTRLMLIDVLLYRRRY